MWNESAVVRFVSLVYFWNHSSISVIVFDCYCTFCMFTICSGLIMHNVLDHLGETNSTKWFPTKYLVSPYICMLPAIVQKHGSLHPVADSKMLITNSEIVEIEQQLWFYAVHLVVSWDKFERKLKKSFDLCDFIIINFTECCMTRNSIS